MYHDVLGAIHLRRSQLLPLQLLAHAHWDPLPCWSATWAWRREPTRAFGVVGPQQWALMAAVAQVPCMLPPAACAAAPPAACATVLHVPPLSQGEEEQDTPHKRAGRLPWRSELVG